MKVNVTTSTIKKLKITEVVRLDPIDVMLEDTEPGKGRIVICCYTKAWTASWGCMGERTIAQFFCSFDEHYLAKNLDTEISATIEDGDAIVPAAKKEICKMRRERDIRKNAARQLWESLDDIDGLTNVELWTHSSILAPIFGEDWWHSMPSRPNPDYEYLCKIIAAVQSGLRMDEVNS
ncbi:hypothetical protein [Undibacterium crateris]|uniref:hypothetical protein n=1 Tax=Undibacterium crateris TaxID=2528175 RepID=UPI0013895E16|nr:hypothetical protein [Undibacterium crateris]NDI85095.1 hypothetical protein [Undibacterium crateris]